MTGNDKDDDFIVWFDDSKTEPYKSTEKLPDLLPEKQRELDARINEIFKRLSAEEPND